ncbi:MarR family transcriptional regulator [Halobiforma nitratireducens]|uniref:HTH marR-type domain-containing protein n=1 Tax=Halobiforma nitratireducens JCM 10879 TaxID=1227454 RepID=M0MG61_9EURY|nr:MarR family transcriptional regulator [Halobiforma nitratireducens]EMA43679.1 hypothetical protein C446_03179 [Halobiforma nitratireducens JCM 10879]
MSRCSDRALLELLAERGPLQVTHLAAALDVHPLTVTQRCDALQSNGYVRRVSADVFGLTEDGREHLASLTDATDSPELPDPSNSTESADSPE